MNDERLLFGVALAVGEMDTLLAEVWGSRRAPSRMPTLDELNRLEQLSRSANSAIIALRQRAAGVKPPKLGD